MSAHARHLIAEQGDDAPISWVHRDDRFGEKLATPDTSIADLIGEVDPIKVAEGRYLSDELTLHYGLVPRTNRGIFAINELPDLAERIQVGLLNVLEERDVQVRGYKIRLPLDLMLFASANPEDYTNRGRIITPLKDRFGAQIRTHYPLEVDIEVDIAQQEATKLVAEGIDVEVPSFMAEIVATLSHLARQSPHINQRSGVSVRLTVSNLETLVANAARRSLLNGETDVVPRVSDLEALASSTAGKVEIESIEEGRDEQIVDHLLRSAVLTVFKDHFAIENLRDVLDAFDDQAIVSAGDDVASADYVRLVELDGRAAPAGQPAGRATARSPALVGQRRRVRARGPAPLQAPQQGSCRRPRPVPQPLAPPPRLPPPADPPRTGSDRCALPAHRSPPVRAGRRALADELADAVGAGDDDPLDHGGREQAVLDDAGDGAERGAERVGIVDGAEVRVDEQVAVVAATVTGGRARGRPGPAPGRPRPRGRSRAPRAACRRGRGGGRSSTRRPPR